MWMEIPSPTEILEATVIVAPELTVKLPELMAVLQPTLTEIVPVVAPGGTVVVMLVAVLPVTTAVVPLNIIMLSTGMALKFVPVIVTVAPIEPLVGVKLLMAGVEENMVFRKTDTLLLFAFATTRSTLPSASMSSMKTERGLVPVVKSTLVA